MSPSIEVERQSGSDLCFMVTIAEHGGRTRHEVTLDDADFERLKGSSPSPEEFVRRCFEFLLERESKESILPEFDVSVISRYFPEFERDIASR